MMRHWMNRWLLVVLLTFAAWLSVRAQEQVRPEAVGLSAEKLQRVDQLLADAVEKKQLAGGVVLVMRKGKVGYLKTVGMRDVEAKEPMTPDTIFRIASMTKPITSVAAMMLVDEGKLRVEDPVSKYVPEFKSPSVLVNGSPSSPRPAKNEMTVHQLLTHTSGLTYGFMNRAGVSERLKKIPAGLAEAEGSLAEHMKRLAEVPLVHEPGTAWEYSLSTDLLGRVVEVASGQDLDAFFRERIFKPLKMHDTMFYFPPRGDSKPERLAALYTIGEEKTISRAPEGTVGGPLPYSATKHFRGPRTHFSGGGGLVSTAPDYARFLQMLLNGGELDGVRILKPETVKRMTSDQLGALKFSPNPHGDRFGYGFGVFTTQGKDKHSPAQGSYSWGGAYRTFFWVDPQNEMLGVVMTQIFPFEHALAVEAQKRVYESLAK